MEKEIFVKVPYHFPGITVLVPMESEIVAIDGGSILPNNIQDKTENFTLIRQIANIVLLTREDYENGRIENPVKTFSPPIEFRVGYNFYDLMESNCNINDLKLAYWNGKEWIIISDPQYDYRILPPSTGQVAEVKIWSWVGDPMLAWGK